MATFEITTPDGRVFEVVGKDAQGAAAAVKKMLSSQPQQQDDRSFPRAIADVGASFAGAIPKAAGAMVSIGSQVPVLNKVADPIAQSLMNAGEFVDDALLSDYQKNMNADMANAVAKSAIQLGPDATISDHIENMKSQGGAAAKFIMENPSQALMLTSQALPYLVGGGIIGRGVAKLAPSTAGATAGAIGEGSIAAGAVTGDIIAQLEAEGIEGYTPDRLAALPAGVLTAVIGRMGAKVNQKLGGADVDTAIAGGGTGAATRGLSPKGAAIGGTTELGEEFLQSAQEQAFTNIGTGDPISDEVGSSAVQGAAAGFGMGSVIGSNVFNRDGSPRNPTDLQIAQRAAAADVARSLRKTAEDNEYNLGDIDPTSGYGAKQALEDYRRTQVTAIVNLVKSLKSQLNPKQAQSLEQLLQDYVPAEAGITAAKRKVSAKVTTDQFDAVKRLVAGTQEGDTLLQELQKSNIVTDLFKDGMKGGVSKFTDLFNPLMTGGQSYDPTRVGNVVVGGLPLLSTGGQSLIPQAAIVLGGQAIDKVLGGKGGTRRKLVERFVKLNEGNDGLGRPTGPSLIAQAQQAERQEEQEAESSAALKEAVRRFRSERGGPEPDSAPLGMLYMGTGLDRSGLEQLLPHLEQHYGDRPEVTELINQTRRNLAGDNNQITGLTDWISILNSVLSSDATIDGLRIADPDGNDARNQRRLAGFGPSAPQSSAGTAQQQQQTQGRSPAEQSGIDSNRALLERLRQGLAANKSLTPAERGRLETAFDQLGDNLGSEPAVAAMDVVSKLKSDGISESLINRHIMPYVERVLRQQARSGRQQPPTSTGNTDLAFDEDFSLDTLDTNIKKSTAGSSQNPYDVYTYVDPASKQPLGEMYVISRGNSSREVATVKVEPFARRKGIATKLYDAAGITEPSDNLTYEAFRFWQSRKPNALPDSLYHHYDALMGKEVDGKGTITDVRNTFASVKSGGISTPLYKDELVKLGLIPAPTGGTDLALDEDFDASKPALTDNVPTGEVSGVPLETYLPRAYDIAKREVYKKGRDLKLAIQKRSLQAQRSSKINLREMTPVNEDRLADFAVADALEALKTNSNAIGWYDKTVSEALSQMAQVFPEIATDPKAKLQFVWALAATSNGTKVDKNLELASIAYEHLQKTGRFPTDIGIGKAAKAIRSGLQMYHTMLDKFNGDHAALEQFSNSQFTVKDLEERYGIPISGEGANETVRGAAVLGPKIGNGFFSNLYGNFDALTIDRWNMRTVGRWRGDLVVINKKMIKKKRDELWSILSSMPDEDMRSLRKLYKGTRTKLSNTVMSDRAIDKWANATAKLSQDPDWRNLINDLGFEEVRKKGNGLFGYLDGQREAPSGPTERAFIRRVFEKALDRLNNNPTVLALPSSNRSNQPLTMSDLQALLWYPEKLLYDTAKKPVGEESKGYKDDEAPDYANAARKFVNNRQANSQRGRLGLTNGTRGRGRGTGTPIDGPNGQSIGILQSQQGPDASRQRGVLSQSDVSGQGQGTSATLEELDALREGKSPEALAAFVAKDGWSILTATQEAIGDHDHPQNIAANEDLLSHLEETGVPFIEVTGMYLGTPQGKSFLILSNEDAAVKLGQRFNQDSVLTVRGFVYSDPSTPVTPSTGVITAGPEALKEENYTDVAGQPFAMGLDFGSDSFDQDVGALAQQPAQQPQQQSPFNMKSLVNKMLGSQPATPEQVKAQLPEVRALFEIGKKGSKYENGIQNLDDALVLADALGLTVRMFDVQQDMMDAVGVSNRVRGVFRSSTKEVFGLKAGTPSDTLGTITDLEALTTMLHEIGHGMAAGVGPTEQSTLLQLDNDMNSDATMVLNSALTPENQRSNREYALSGSFEAAMFPHLAIDYTGRGSKIQQEIINLQENIEVYLAKNPKQTRKVRKILQVKENAVRDGSGLARLEFIRHLQYVRGNREFAVDPLWVYMANPKLARAVMPMTTALIKKHFKDAQSTDIQFFAHPLAVSLAVVLAMMLNGRAEEEEEEQMRQQMPAGALSPQAGALSQQQQFAA